MKANKYFTVEELVSKDVYDLLGDEAIKLFDPKALEVLEDVREILGIPLTGTSVNPARSLAPALFLGGEALKQVWVFIVAPIIGSILAGLFYKFVLKKGK